MINSVLTQEEEVAKDFVLNLLLAGSASTQPCDKTLDEDAFKRPEWYDDVKYKRGQKYFRDNRVGIMVSNLYGMFSLIAEPRGGRILDYTGKSSTAETAKKRYISTTVHMINWYQCDLTPGSKSWESLKYVRKMHFVASKVADDHKLGKIAQASMSVTQFGFMGYALIRPHLLGIKHDNDDDRRAFVHFWAVIGFMLGIKDEYNMCLHPLNVVESICRILVRYSFIPNLQLETPTFKRLGKAYIEGMRFFMPFVSFESRLFMVKRIAGVPGYQYDIKVPIDYYQKEVFNAEELKQLNEHFQTIPGHESTRHLSLGGKMYLLNVKKLIVSNNLTDENENISPDWLGADKNSFLEFLGLNYPSELEIVEVDERFIGMYMNDRKFHELSYNDQRKVKASIRVNNQFANRFAKLIQEAIVSVHIFLMKRFVKNGSFY